jgi:hypothetical protein
VSKSTICWRWSLATVTVTSRASVSRLKTLAIGLNNLAELHYARSARPYLKSFYRPRAKVSGERSRKWMINSAISLFELMGSGLDKDSEPTQRGLQLEELIDIVNRLNLRK